MKTETTYEIQDLDNWKGIFSTFGNVMGLTNLNSVLCRGDFKNKKKRTHTDTNGLGLIWVESGSCILSIDEMPYTLQQYSFFLIPPSDSICLNEISPDFKAKLLIAEKTFMDGCAANKQVLSFFNCLFVKRLLQTELEKQEVYLLSKGFNELKEKVEDTQHSFHNELVAASFKTFLLELTHILNKKEENKAFQQFTRKEEVFNKFIDLLLVHYKEQHEVTFYADKLFITPQYLTMIIKSLTGKTTNKWIDETLILEARKLLKTTQAPVQQIADQLNFSDQSTFGKFFKKYLGMSPVEYRKLQFHSPAMAI